MQETFPYTWSKTTISYLGLKLSSDPGSLADSNYLPLIDKITKDIARFANIELSWSGRLAAFKMLILPQILYIFRTLPIPVPSIHPKTLNALLSKFIWKNRSPKCSRLLLIRHRLAGGMGLVDIRNYFRASILTQLKSWLDPKSNPVWKGIKQNLCPTGNLSTFLLLDVWRPFFLRGLPLTLQASLVAWRFLRNVPSLKSDLVEVPIPINILS